MRAPIVLLFALAASSASAQVAQERLIPRAEIAGVLAKCQRPKAGGDVPLNEAVALTLAVAGTTNVIADAAACRTDPRVAAKALAAIIGDPVRPDAPFDAIQSLLIIAQGGYPDWRDRWAAFGLLAYRDKVWSRRRFLSPIFRLSDADDLQPDDVAFLIAASRENASTIPNQILAQHILLTESGPAAAARALALLEMPKVVAQPSGEILMLRARILAGGLRGVAGQREAVRLYRALLQSSMTFMAQDVDAIASLFSARAALAGTDLTQDIDITALAIARGSAATATQARTELAAALLRANGGPVPVLTRDDGVEFRKPFVITSDDYPASAMRSAEQGRVQVRVLVDPRGMPVLTDIAVSSGHASLDTASVRIVSRRMAAGFVLPPKNAGRYAWIAMPAINWAIAQ